MPYDLIEALPVTAAEARRNVAELRAERALAESTGVAHVRSYMHDLEQELELWSQMYVTSAVTEIATLRATLFGAKQG